MAKGRKAQTKMSRGAWALVTLAGVVVVAGAYFLLRDSPEVVESQRVYERVSDFADVHGIAVNPENAEEVYVATHHGLIRGRNGTWERVGTMQDDLMGFSMHPTNGSTFWTSGHPKSGGNMGVRLSTDGGFTWRRIALDGVDFHAMTVSPANPDHLWGAWRGQVYRSTNGGLDWQTFGNAPAIRSFAAHPTEPDTIYATTQTGIARSTDGGASWSIFANLPAYGLAIDPKNPRVMYAGLADGVTKSADGGATWTRTSLRTSAPAGYLSVSAQDPGLFYVATYRTAIHKSMDAGATWTMLKEGSA